jgi:Zn-dependent protease
MAFGDRPRDRQLMGVPRAALQPSALFLALVAVVAVSGVLLWRSIGYVHVNVLVFVLAGWLVSLCLHEYAHAVIAYRGGDVGVAERGYLTLNPLKYTHPVLSFVLPVLFLLLGGIALPGGAVWVDRHAIRSRRTDSLISLAGPATNLLFALGLALPFVAGVDVIAHPEFWGALAYLAFLQLLATVLNLVPLPGIDGGNAIEPWLNERWKRGFAHVAPYGLILLFALLWTPQLSRPFFLLVAYLADLVGVPGGMVAFGHELFPTLAPLL